MRSFICSIAFLATATFTTVLADDVHVPAKGSAERKALLDAMRAVQFPKQDVVYVVNYMKVHNDWAWVDISPQDRKGQAVAEGGPSLWHCKKGQWTYVDTSKVPEDPQDPLGPEDASPGFVKNLQKVFRDVPSDIFPKAKK